MSYNAEISRRSPAAILFVVDQSTSMRELIDDERSKSAFLADVLNKTIYTLITTCSKSDGVRDYFYVAVIAYAGAGAHSGFQGVLSQDFLHPISKIADEPLRIESRTRKTLGPDDRVTTTPVKFPIWFDPSNRGRTPTCAGLSTAYEVAKKWCETHQESYPPTILHVSDGHATDGNPEAFANAIRCLGTQDGPCLLFNLHLDVGARTPLVFPNDERLLHDRFGKTLFRMSSELPAHAIRAAQGKGIAVKPGSKAFIFNAGVEEIVDFFDIGTRPARMEER